MPFSTLTMRKMSDYAVKFVDYAESREIEIPNEDVRDFFTEVKDQETLRAAITEYFGPRCQEDESSYLNTPEHGICWCCEAWLAFDRFTGSTVYPAAVIEGL